MKRPFPSVNVWWCIFFWVNSFDWFHHESRILKWWITLEGERSHIPFFRFRHELEWMNFRISFPFGGRSIRFLRVYLKPWGYAKAGPAKLDSEVFQRRSRCQQRCSGGGGWANFPSLEMVKKGLAGELCSSSYWIYIYIYISNII